MADQSIAVSYMWTPKPGKEAELKATYETVAQYSRDQEPGISRMDLYEAPTGALVIDEVFDDAGALGAHLGGIAAERFPALAEIATPGPFWFCGDVPQEIIQAAEQMNMGAVFATHVTGFTRAADSGAG